MLCPACKLSGERHKLKLIYSSCSQRHEREAVNYDSFSVGLHLQSQGVRALHPVIMIPGVISTGLESWGTEKESIQYFRKRLWGSWSMMRALVLDKASWKRHIMRVIFSESFLPDSYCILSFKTCRRSQILSGHVSRLQVGPRRNMLTVRKS